MNDNNKYNNQLKNNFITPVLFMVFNRLDTTKKVFKKISLIKPPKLYISCDGPRESIFEEAKRVNSLREYLLSNVSWDCEIKTLFFERFQTLGCSCEPFLLRNDFKKTIFGCLIICPSGTFLW